MSILLAVLVTGLVMGYPLHRVCVERDALLREVGR